MNLRSPHPLPLERFRPLRWGDRVLRSRGFALYVTLAHLAMLAGLISALLPFPKP